MSLQEPTRSFLEDTGGPKRNSQVWKEAGVGQGAHPPSFPHPAQPPPRGAQVSKVRKTWAQVSASSCTSDRPTTSRKQWGKLGGPDSLARACLLPLPPGTTSCLWPLLTTELAKAQIAAALAAHSHLVNSSPVFKLRQRILIWGYLLRA